MIDLEKYTKERKIEKLVKKELWPWLKKIVRKKNRIYVNKFGDLMWRLKTIDKIVEGWKEI